jgi:hypothetical protein
MSSIAEKSRTEQSSIKSVSNFLRQYKIGTDLKRVGAHKQKGIPVLTVVNYLISLVYIGKSMFEDMRSENPLAQGFCRDVVYRFLNQAFVNWQALLLCIAGKVVAEFDRLTSADRLTAFVIDDSFYPVLYAKATELVSLIHDHAEKGKNKYKWGFRMLALCWTDGVSLVPLAFRHLASADEKKQRCGVNPTLDKRSRAYRIRKEAVSKATEVLLLHLKAVQKAGIAAKHVLFDSWFAYPITIFKICALKLHVTARVKNTAKLKYLVNGIKKTASEIYRENRKRRGKSRYLLSADVMLYTSEDGKENTMPAKLVYVRIWWPRLSRPK